MAPCPIEVNMILFQFIGLHSLSYFE